MRAILTVKLPGVLGSVLKTVSIDESIGEIQDMIVHQEAEASRKMTLSEETINYFIKTPVSERYVRAWSSMPKKEKLRLWSETYDCGRGVKLDILED